MAPRIVALCLCGLMMLPGCVARMDRAEALAARAGMTFRMLPTRGVGLASWGRDGDADQPLTLYLEGDGAAYDADGYPSLDPTPRRALGLELATRDRSINLAYLARPCQFVETAKCDAAHWSRQRYSEPMIDLVNDAITAMVRPGQGIHLIGISGGGTIAVMIALRRIDVLSLRTVAGNLDPHGLGTFHRDTEPLEAPDLPGLAPELARLPQRHFVGSRDPIVPARFALEFVGRQGPSGCAAVTEIEASHDEGWTEQWPDLVAQPVSPCQPGPLSVSSAAPERP